MRNYCEGCVLLMPARELSASASAKATDAITTAVRQFSGAQLLADDVAAFHEQLRLRGLAIVEVSCA